MHFFDSAEPSNRSTYEWPDRVLLATEAAQAAETEMAGLLRQICAPTVALPCFPPHKRGADEYFPGLNRPGYYLATYACNATRL